ncbi:1-phosphatidylinositol-4,5-bisphosphate phosphodiesterase 1 [Gautieria morchelliformis]|nr:1-phosphatidylinositol-4,5-bisphosphate phosphodiesterase 1 [Gautieria morchelliformis]
MDGQLSNQASDRPSHTLHEAHEEHEPTSGSAEQQPQFPSNSSSDEVKVPVLLLHGTPLIKVSAKKVQARLFKLDPDQGQIIWESKKSGVIAIESIKEIRAGEDARNYREQFKIASDTENRWMTIIYLADGKYKTLHVIALAADVFRMWFNTLKHLYALRQELMSGVGNLERRQQAWERLYWKSADESGDARLAWVEVKKLCLRLNVHAPEEDLKQRFKEADIHNRGWLDFKDFQRFVKLLKARPELKRLYNSIRGAGVFDFDAFTRFMRQCQKSSLSESELEKMFHRFALIPPQSPALPTNKALPDTLSASPASFAASLPLPSTDDTPSQSSSSDSHLVLPVPSPAPSPQRAPNPLPSESSGSTLSLEGFSSFLLSAENSPFTDHHARVWHDMTRPLSEYYISSSHNTYLVGHQLVGVSTIEGYIRALLHSCRSVELDIFDGDSGPVIFHGKTLTSKVSLREVCLAIAKYAFVASPYPIIISAEVHCSLAQQDQIAEIMKTTFGDALVTAPLQGREVTDTLPSPEELKGRVLIKAKNLYVDETQAILDKAQPFDTESSSTENSISDSEHLRAELKELKTEFEQGLSRARSVLQRVRGQSGASSPSKARRTSNTEPDRPKIKMSFALAALLVYTVGVKCRGFNKKEQYAVEHIFSLSESTANKILKQGMMDLIKHNRTHVVRTYPKGLRLNSSNYDPHRYWAAGAQLVAINWQTFDLGYMINHAMFQRNGRVGYVLKPLALRSSDKTLLARRTEYYFDVTIISAQQLPRAKDKDGREILTKHIVDPFVEVTLLIPDWTHSPFDLETSLSNYSSPTSPGSSASSTARTVTYRTGVVKNNGFNPVWEEALSIPFDCVGEMKDLIFVKFEVKEDDGEEHSPLAVYCSSLGSLEEGFRHLPLHDQQLSQYLFSTLFVQIQVRAVA